MLMAPEDTSNFYEWLPGPRYPVPSSPRKCNGNAHLTSIRRGTNQPHNESSDQREEMMKRTLLLVCATALAFAGGILPASASTTVTYAITQAAATPVYQCNDTSCGTTVTGYTVNGPGTVQSPPAPTYPSAGDFTLTFSADRVSPSDSCRMKSGTGTLDVVWNDSTTSTGTFSFKARDSKTLSLTGKITGGTSPVYLPNPLRGFVAFPLSPCLGGAVPASITLISST
jgi:hypothetical protein